MTKRMKRKITAALLLTVLVFTAFREPLMKLAKEATFYWFDHTETELMVKAYAEENRLFFSDYPESLIALLERNPETKEFVLEYPQYRAEGYDLSQYAGKKVMRYVYSVTNYPGATAPVYATLLIYKNQVIGGDITDTAPGGKIQGLKKLSPSETTPTESIPGTTAAQ